MVINAIYLTLSIIVLYQAFGMLNRNEAIMFSIFRKYIFVSNLIFMLLGRNVVHILCSCVLLSFRVTVNSNPAV